MVNRHGDFIWYELRTRDIHAAEAFYGPLLGWTFANTNQTDREYRLASINGNAICGFINSPEAVEESPCWLGYIAVGDAYGAAIAIEDAGGKVLMEPIELPNIGQIALVADPQGATFYIMQPAPSTGLSDDKHLAFSVEERMNGHCAWNELVTTHQQAAMSFYTEQFSWKAGNEHMDMGEAGTYEFFRHKSALVAGVMSKPHEAPRSTWLYYFRVADIDVAVAQINSHGGQIIMDPVSIPGDQFMVQGLDPHNARFALVGSRVSKTP